MEFSEFNEFIKDNINVIENENIELENVETEKDECCGYSEEKKNQYLEEKLNDEKKKLHKYFQILKENSEKQKNKYINNYLVKLSAYFGEYNKEEKKNIISIQTVLNNTINEIFKDINDYHLYVEKSYENSVVTFKKETEKIKMAKKLNEQKKVDKMENKKIEEKENKKLKIDEKGNEKIKLEKKENEKIKLENKDNEKIENKENEKIKNKENEKIKNKENEKIENKENEKIKNKENEKIENKDNEKIENKENEKIENKENEKIENKENEKIENKENEKIKKLKEKFQNINIDNDEGFGFKKMDIFIYPGKNIDLKGISIKIYKEFYPELSTPFISVAFPPKNINLFEKITSYLIDFEKSKGEKIFVISKEKSLERIMMKINFIKNFKYYNWIEMFSNVFNKFSLFKFEFLTPIMLNQPMDNKAFYDILKSFLLIQIQGDIPIRTIFEFLRVEKIVTIIITQLIPDYMRVLLKALTSITFTLNTSIEEIPYKDFIKKEINQKNSSNISFLQLIQAFLGIPDAFIDSEDVEINFRLFRNNLKILLNLPSQNFNISLDN